MHGAKGNVPHVSSQARQAKAKMAAEKLCFDWSIDFDKSIPNRGLTTMLGCGQCDSKRSTRDPDFKTLPKVHDFEEGKC